MTPIKTMNGLLKKYQNQEDRFGSELIAKGLGTTHQKILQAIAKSRNYIKSHSTSEFSENKHFNPIFVDSTYMNERGRKYKCVDMNLDGALVLVKLIDTQEAYNLYAEMMSAFKKLMAEENARIESKKSFRPMTDQLERLQKKLKEEDSGFAPFTYTTINDWIKKQVLAIPNRDGSDPEAFTEIKNVMQQTLRDEVEKLIHVSLEDGKSGRETKDLVKEFLKDPQCLARLL